MKVVATRQNRNGTYDMAGMNNRVVIGPYKLRHTIERMVRRWEPVKRVRIEVYSNTLSELSEPYRVYYLPEKTVGRDNQMSEAGEVANV